jgi:hypothetical protein
MRRVAHALRELLVASVAAELAHLPARAVERAVAEAVRAGGVENWLGLLGRGGLGLNPGGHMQRLDGGVPQIHLDDRTLVQDAQTKELLAYFGARLPLPLESRILLADPPRIATVIGVRVLSARDAMPALLCLDVEVQPDE